MYFRNSSPRTRCLYSADSTLPRSLFAASNRAAAFGVSPFPFVFINASFGASAYPHGDQTHLLTRAAK